MLSPKQIRESRGTLALLLAAAFVLVIIVACFLHPAGKTALGIVQVVYCGLSALIVTSVLLFGVGTWSRFLPQNDGEAQADAGNTATHPNR
jgi:peptidoglycan/LPS O-acetylase OafA/YrhL